MTGVVLDASTGAPVSGAFLSIGESGPRAIADAEGRFRIANVPPGSQRLSVERFGYERLELVIAVTPALAPLELRMRVDLVQLRGLTVTGGAKAPISGVVLDARSPRTTSGGLGIPRCPACARSSNGVSAFQPCGSTSASANCIVMFGRTYAPRVVIDELGYPDGLDMLWAYDTDELHSIEFFRCRPPQIRVYTHDYMERVARKPRMLEPTCILL